VSIDWPKFGMESQAQAATWRLSEDNYDLVQSMEGVMKSVGSFLRLIPQLERRREAAGGSAAAVAPYDLLALKAKDTQLLIMLPALNRQTRKLKARSKLSPGKLVT